MKDIHFDCPKCQRNLSGPASLSADLVSCPDCGEQFIPVVKESTASAVPRPTPKQQAILNQAKGIRNPVDEQAKIRRQAESFFIMAVGLFVIAALIIGGAILTKISGEDPGNAFATVGWFIAGGFWLYLVAQIIHIRANTHK